MLTILVPIWQHNVQFLRSFTGFLAKTKCPYHIIFVSSVDSAIREIDNRLINSVHYKYFDNFTDKTVNDFTGKIHQGVNCVDTPYTIMVDNDDLICHQNFRHHINFLENNPHFVASRGEVTHWEQSGALTRCYNKPSILGATAKGRFTNGIKNFHSNWHDIVRTEVLKFTHRLIYKSGTNDLKVVIRLNSLIPCIIGQINREDDHAYYWHNVRQGQIATNTQLLPKGQDWFNRPYWKTSVAQMVSILGNLINKVDNVNNGYEIVCQHIGDIDGYIVNLNDIEIIPQKEPKPYCKPLSNEEFRKLI